MNIIKGAGSLFLMAVGVTLAAKGGKYFVEAITDGIAETKDIPRIIVIRKEAIDDVVDAAKEAAETVKETAEAVQS